MRHTHDSHDSYEATAESNEGKDVVETPRQEGESCRGVGQGITGTLRYG